MDILEKFIRQVSYRFPKGYPDMNNEQDVLLLESILRKDLDIDISENFKQLQFKDLKKYGGPRLQKVADKIKKKEPFATTTGEQILLDFNDSEYESLFVNADVEGLKALAKGRINSFPFFVDENGEEYTIQDLLKSSDLGGKTSGSATRVETIALEDLNRKIQELGTIDVKLTPSGKVHKGISKATTVQGTPKADFTLDNENGPVIFISHKDGSKPTHFQQYSGFQAINKYSEVREFIEAVRKRTGGELQPKTVFKRKLEKEEPKLKAVYGKDQQVGNYGIDNCQVLLQGSIELELDPEDNVYLVKANHKVQNPNVPEGDYEPYMYVTFRRERNNEGVKNARFGIYTKAYYSNAVEI